ncbi:hypothetical protein F4819DRAFT_442336 [Hypoxylon fuscum]|nr:hypothetical protein F4819DRAFT_442336 [Hypoxylon fuscum]
MYKNIAIRWAGRLRPRLSGCVQTARLGSSGRATPFRLYLSPQRQFSSLPARRNHESQAQAQAQHFEKEAQLLAQAQSARKRSTHKQWLLFNLAGLGAVIVTAMTLKSAGTGSNDKDSVINKTSFSPFTIVSKEQVSPTAFILRIRAGDGSSNAKRGPGSARAFEEAWEHGLWSVEIKQPQLQIARHYTPLPPLPPPQPTAITGENDDAELRFLVRKVEGGEMSTYLSKLGVGDKVYLRGPHLGFDVERRLGDAGNDVVFVAGGTGIAPALQVARRLLDPMNAGRKGESNGGSRKETPTVSILWANRRAADALGRPRPQQHNHETAGGKSWFSNWWGGQAPPSAKVEDEQQAEEPSFTQQIRALERQHPGRFRISYFVDEERSIIGSRDLRAVLSNTLPSPHVATRPVDEACPWHSLTALEALPDDNDASRRAAGCVCAGGIKNKSTASSTGTGVGVNLICVSGPDGFVEAIAGPKRWHAGTEMQGPVRGMLGPMLKGEEGNWLVLKI